MVSKQQVDGYINKAQGLGDKIYQAIVGFVQNPTNKIIIGLFLVVSVLFLISRKESFQNTDYMYLKNNDSYLCCDLSFKKDKPSSDSIKMLENSNGTVNVKFNENDTYLGVNRNNLLVANELDPECSYEFVIKDNIMRSVKNGMYVARSGNDLVLSSTKDRALHFNAE